MEFMFGPPEQAIKVYTTTFLLLFDSSSSRNWLQIDQCGGLIGKATISMVCATVATIFCVEAKLQLPSQLRT
jgi:hypothetical protein